MVLTTFQTVQLPLSRLSKRPKQKKKKIKKRKKVDSDVEEELENVSKIDPPLPTSKEYYRHHRFKSPPKGMYLTRPKGYLDIKGTSPWGIRDCEDHDGFLLFQEFVRQVVIDRLDIDQGWNQQDGKTIVSMISAIKNEYPILLHQNTQFTIIGVASHFLHHKRSYFSVKSQKPCKKCRTDLTAEPSSSLQSHTANSSLSDSPVPDTPILDSLADHATANTTRIEDIDPLLVELSKRPPAQMEELLPIFSEGGTNYGVPDMRALFPLAQDIVPGIKSPTQEDFAPANPVASRRTLVFRSASLPTASAAMFDETLEAQPTPARNSPTSMNPTPDNQGSFSPPTSNPDSSSKPTPSRPVLPSSAISGAMIPPAVPHAFPPTVPPAVLPAVLASTNASLKLHPAIKKSVSSTLKPVAAPSSPSETRALCSSNTTSQGGGATAHGCGCGRGRGN